MDLTLRKKLLVLSICCAIVPAGAVAYFAYDAFTESAEASQLEALEGLARAKAASIDQFTDSRKKDVQRIAELLGPPVERLIAAEVADKPPKDPEPEPPLEELSDAAMTTEGSPSETPPPPAVPVPVPQAPPKAAAKAEGGVGPARTELRRTLGLLVGEQSTFEELLVIGPDGRVLASTFSPHEGKTAAAVEYFQRGMASTFVQPVFLSPITEELTMVIATPIRSEEGGELGVLAARLNLKRFFRLINDYTGLGETGETLVGKKIGEKVVLMAPTRHDDSAALNRTIAVRRLNPGLVAAARGATDSGIIEDYRGEPTLAAWTFAPALEWGVLTKIDQAEADRPLTQVRGRVLLITIGILVLAVAASALFAGTIIAPLRQLKEATEKISKGSLDIELNINSRDEIGDLADSFERMLAAIKFFREQSDEGEGPDAGADRHSRAS